MNLASLGQTLFLSAVNRTNIYLRGEMLVVEEVKDHQKVRMVYNHKERRIFLSVFEDGQSYLEHNAALVLDHVHISEGALLIGFFQDCLQAARAEDPAKALDHLFTKRRQKYIIDLLGDPSIIALKEIPL